MTRKSQNRSPQISLDVLNSLCYVGWFFRKWEARWLEDGVTEEPGLCSHMDE